MVICFLVAVYFSSIHEQVGFETDNRVAAALHRCRHHDRYMADCSFSYPTNMETMVGFINKMNPGGPGCQPVREKAKALGMEIREPSGPGRFRLVFYA